MKFRIPVLILVLAALVISACGTAVTAPVPLVTVTPRVDRVGVVPTEAEADVLEQDPPQAEEVIATEAPTEAPTEEPVEAQAVVPTEVPTEMPTEAPTEQPTEAPTDIPTEVPTEVPTSTPMPDPTEAPTEAPAVEPTAVAEEAEGEGEVIAAEPEVFPPTPEAQDITTILVSVADPAAGDALFHQEYDTNAGPYMCSTCHYVDSAEMLIGPGMLNIGLRAWNRIEENNLEYESAAEYLFNSIVHPNDYLVEGYAANIMPGNYGDLMSDDDIYNIVAYLLTLTDQ